MKTIIKSTLLLLSVFLAVGCKLDTSHNGKLDGYWKLTTVPSVSLTQSQRTSCLA